ncbi:MAG: DUF4419 domain-containing protein, partial [Chloroflexota bacterium]
MGDTDSDQAQSIHRVSFNLSDVPLADNLLRELPAQQALKEKLNLVVEACSNPQKPLVRPYDKHAFIEAAHTAFDEHRPLVIAPDHIWLLICQGFAKHVNLNAEALRTRFVLHTDRKLLEVVRSDFVKGSPNNPWEEVFPEFTRQIQAHLIGDVYDILTAQFSTTTATEKAAFEITLMDTFKAYFDFYFSSLCGIPSITLEGSPEDWRSILERTRRLSQYDLDWWVQSLIPVLEALVRTSEGEIDIAFWKSFYKEKSVSGGPYITGWLVKFFPYMDKKRNPFLNHSDESYFTSKDAESGLA